VEVEERSVILEDCLDCDFILPLLFSRFQPRYVVDIASQQEDYKSVLDWVRLQPEFDPEEVILFGSSLGTGHATCLAAKDHRIAAVIGVNPMSNPIKSMNAVIGPNNAPLVPMANLDWLLSLGSRISVFPPIYVKPAHKYDLEKKKPVRKFQLSLVNPGDTAERFAEIAKNSTEGRVDSNIPRRTAFKGFSPPPPYLSIYFSEPYTYKIAARILVTLPLYAPTLKASKVQCPYFLLISKGEDLILTTRSAKKMALKAPRGSYEIVGDEKSGHFSPYEHTTTGNAVEEICEKAGEFLKRTVPL